MLRDQKTNKGKWNLKTKIEIGWTYSKNERQQMDQALHKVASQEREKIKRMA